jgi:hypothetical protein
MVRVLVGDKNAVDVPDSDAGLPQLPQKLLSAAGVHQQLAFRIFVDKTGVKAVKGHGMTRAEHRNFFHMRTSVVSFSYHIT